MLCVPLIGWIERISQTCITFAKLEGERDELAIPCSLSVMDDFSWHVVAGGNKLSSTSELLSAMPQPVSCVRDVLLVIEFLDSLVPCCGNNDKKFLLLSTSRNGSFPSASGKNFVFLVSTCTCIYTYMYMHVQCVLHVLHVSIQLYVILMCILNVHVHMCTCRYCDCGIS